MFRLAIYVLFVTQICFTNQYRLDREDLNYEESLIQKDPIFVSMREFCEGRHIRLCSGNNLLKFFRNVLNEESNVAVATTTEAIETTTEASPIKSETFSHDDNDIDNSEKELENLEKEKQVKGKTLVKNIIKDFHQLFSN